MLSLINEPGLDTKIIMGKFDAHSYMLFKIKQYLRKVDRPGPGLYITRSMYKDLASPIMYGSKPDSVAMSKRITAMFNKNINVLRPKVTA